MKRKLLLLFACLFGALGGVKAWTSVVPYDGRTYYLYNPGTTSYWYGTNSTYSTMANIADATPITVESGHKLLFTYDNTIYRIYQDAGKGAPSNQSGVNFTFQGDANGYRLKSKHTTGRGDDYDRDMQAGGSFPRMSYNEPNVTWQFISKYDLDSNTPDACASAAESSYLSEANGWERVTDNATLDASLSDYFFAIVCANYPGLMVNMANGNASQQAGDKFSSSKSMWYSNSANPEVDNSFLWMIEPNTTPNYEGYTFRNASYPSLTIQTEWNTGGWGMSWYAHTNDQANPCQWNSYALIPSNGVYTIKTLANGGENYLGLWTPSNDYINGQELAGNKGTAEQGKFLIYRIPKYKLDMTGRVVNPKAETNTDGWDGFNGGVTKRNTGNGFDGVPGFFELCDWGNTWDLSVNQTINNLPNGYYQIQVAGQVAADNTTMTLTANGVSNNFRATGTSGGTILADGTEVASGGVAGWHYNRVLAQVTDGTLTITVHGVATSSQRWGNFDNVSLTYIASSLPESLTSVSGKMNAAVNTAQQNAIETYNNNGKTIENYIAAQDAIVAAEASIAAYANALTYLEKVEEVLATTNFYTTAAYNSVYGTYKTAYDNSTLDDATARDLSYKVAGSGGYARYDANTANDLLIPGWTIGGDDAKTSGSGFYINTWSTESAGSGDAADFANPFYEYWVGSGSLPAKVLSGTLTGLTPNRLYRVTANVRIQGTANSGKIKMQVGTGGEIDVTKGNQIGTTTRYIKDYVAVGKADADGKLTLKFTVESESGISWLSFRDVMYAEQDNDFTDIIKNADCTSNDNWPGGSRTFNNMMAYDGETRNVFSANSNYSIESKDGQRHQTITLPATGAYKLTTFCKVPGTNSNGYAQIWVDDLGNYIDYANARHLYTVDTDGNKTNTINTDGSGWFANEIYFTANAGDSKTIFINLSKGNGEGNIEYAYVSGMKLTYLGTAPEISFDEAIVNPVVEVAHANVTIARNMKSDRWNTFTVPFDMAIPDGWTVKELKGVSYDADAANYSMSFENAEEIKTGKAYMVKPGSDITEVNADDVTINTTTVTSSEVSDGDYTANFVGNNSYLTAVPRGSYIISNNVFYAVDTDIIQKGFRAYITVGGPSPSSARSTVSYDTEGGVTDIQNVVVNGLDESVAQKDGKYFENNKIVIVKNGIKYGSNGQKLN